MKKIKSNKERPLRTKPDYSLESAHTGIKAGIDEAGRGPLAGPVVAAAIIIDPSFTIDGIDDSKKLSPAFREELYEKITSAYIWSVGIVSAEEIDEINILNATKKACVLAEAGLKIRPDVVLVDGNMKFSDPRFKSVVKGDSISVSIAAASVIAKVTRDRIMKELDLKCPGYLWSKNMGYGTKGHIDSLRSLGLSPFHRRSFIAKTLLTETRGLLK